MRVPRAPCCALTQRLVRAPQQSRSLGPRVRVPLVGAGLKTAGGKGGGGWGRLALKAELRRSPAIAPPLGLPACAIRSSIRARPGGDWHRRALGCPFRTWDAQGRSVAVGGPGDPGRGRVPSGAAAASSHRPRPRLLPNRHRRGIPSVVGFLGTGPFRFPLTFHLTLQGCTRERRVGEGPGQRGFGRGSCGATGA